MPRPRKIWWWKARNEWCVKIDNVRHRLGPDKDAAETEFHRLMSVAVAERVDPNSVAAVIDQFLDWTQKNKAKETYEWYQRHLQAFLSSLKPPTIAVSSLKPHHVSDWVDAASWGLSTKRGAMTAVSRCLNWADKFGHIARNPLRGKLEKPTAAKCETVISPEEFKVIQKYATGGFRELLAVSWETGCRPQEIVRVEARHVDLKLGRWIFPRDEAKGKKRPREIYLNDKVLAITKRLVKEHPEGPLFRNQNGKPWTAYAVACGFSRLKTKIGIKYRLYDLRHSYITNGLKNGIDPLTMANLVGHVDLKMTHTIYSHVSKDVQFMREAAKRAVK